MRPRCGWCGEEITQVIGNWNKPSHNLRPMAMHTECFIDMMTIFNSPTIALERNAVPVVKLKQYRWKSDRWY